MVATISARGGAEAALSYYSHLGADNYYTRDGEPPGRWAGEGAKQLSLSGPVMRHDFEAALKGNDPKIGTLLVPTGGGSKSHSAGWDITFSAPKSVSVMWALSDEPMRETIESAHRQAVLTATKNLEQTSAWARRGQGGRIREKTAGLLMAQFDHHTSRDLDPQLHTHSFVFNLAPRKDGSWGAIISRALYKAQKQAGLDYRNALAGELEKQGIAIERDGTNFRVKAVPKHIERVFSKRRIAIEKAAETHGYATPKGMELAALRTRSRKEITETKGLFQQWKAEAKALGFDLKSSLQAQRTPQKILKNPSPGTGIRPYKPHHHQQNSRSKPPLSPVKLMALGALIRRLANQMNRHSAMSGIAPPLGQPAKRKQAERDR